MLARSDANRASLKNTLKFTGTCWMSAAAHMAYRAQVCELACGHARALPLPAAPCRRSAPPAAAAAPTPPACPVLLACLQDNTQNRDLSIGCAVGQALVGSLCLHRGFADD